MKQIKSFRISEENQKRLKEHSKGHDRTQSWVINKAIEVYFSGSLAADIMRGHNLREKK